MKFSVKLLSLVASAVAVMTSCVNDGLQEPQDAAALKMIRPLDEQKASVEASMEELHDLQAALEERDVKLSGMEAVQQRVASLSQAKSLEEGALAAFELQKRIASILGPAIASLDSETYESEFSASFDSLEKGIVKWVGENFTSLYPAALADAKAQVTMSEIDETIAKQQLYVSALESDIKAGLKKDENPDEMASLTASMQEVTAGKEKIGAETAALVAEVEKGYETAVKSILSDPTGYSAASLKELNENAVAAMASSSTSVEDLAERVAACESQLNSILQRLSALETEIEDLEELLGLVQSVTFMSEFSEDKAIAYYTMNVNGTADAQGRKPRTGESTMELKWIVRPASAAAALTSSSLWDNGLKVFGYYASAMTKAAGDFFNYDITKVTADQTLGVVTVTVANTLSKEFYFKETGAKLALSLTTGNTDLTSKFVEIVPKDKSGNVYVESLTISPETIEIDDNQTAKITAKILPENATNQGVVYASSNNDIVTVASDGTVTAKAVGTATITVTASGTDEWGRTLKATCAVKINSSIKIAGAGYVEEGGGQTELHVDSPTYIDPKYVSWEIGTFSYKNDNGEPVGFNTNQIYASIDDNGKVTGLKERHINQSGGIGQLYQKEYLPLVVKCTIEGAIPITMWHEMRVVAVQPLGISISGLADTDTKVTTKVGQGVSLKGTIVPETVNPEYFRITYLGAYEGSFAASSVGSTTVTLSVGQGDDGFDYFYPKGKGLTRNITVNVEPYWVQSISIPEAYEITAGRATTFVPVFTSDSPGVDPTYCDVKWESSNKNVATVDEDGNVTAISKGTATITVTTNHESSVPSGQSPKSASCTLTVKEATVEINVGDYFYSDGTWSSSLNSGKTLIGIVCQVGNPHSVDNKIPSDFINGYVVSVNEISSALAKSTSVYRTHFLEWATSNGYRSPKDNEGYCKWDEACSALAQGYNNTLAFSGWTDAIANADYSGYHGWTLYLSGGALETYRNTNVVNKNKSTDWYVPSQKELTFLSGENLTVINNALRAAGKTEITSQYYWSSSISYQNYVTIDPVSQAGKAGDPVTSSRPVRFFLAF